MTSDSVLFPIRNTDVYLDEQQDILYLKISITNIVDIYNKAIIKSCRIRWFMPEDKKTYHLIKDSNFRAVNSTEIFAILKITTLPLVAAAIILTKVNQYSLVFEYIENSIPIILFSADDDFTFLSGSGAI